MLKNLLLTITMLCASIACYAKPTGPVMTSDIQVANPIFVNGVTGFQNHILVSNVPANTASVVIHVHDQADNTIDTIIATIVGSDWEVTKDMGLLDSTATKFRAVCYDVSMNPLDSVDYGFTIKGMPLSIQSSFAGITVASIDNNTGVAVLHVSVNLLQKDTTVDDGIVGLGGKRLGFSSNRIVFDKEYNIADASVSNVSNSSYNYQLNAFGLTLPEVQVPLDTIPFCSVDLDQNLNPAILVQYKKSGQLFEYKLKDVPLPLPIAPAEIAIGAGIKLEGGFSIKGVMGIDGNTGGFGFIETGTDTSSIDIGATITGSIWATGSLISKHLAGVRATLEAVGRIGSSYQFQTVPSLRNTFLFGGDLLVKGTVELTGLSGFAKSWFCARTGSCEPTPEIVNGVVWPWNNHNNPMQFGSGYPTGLVFDRVIHDVNNSSFRARSFQSDYHFDIPEQIPQPAFANNGNIVGAVWMDPDSVNQKLLLSFLDTVLNKFTDPIEVLKDDSSVIVTSPKVALFGDGSAIIAWAQSKRTKNNIDTANTTFYDLLDAEDIWYAVYDKDTKTIIAKAPVSDNSNRAESQPTIAVGKNGKAIVTWLAEDPNGDNTDIWYTEISKANGNWDQTVPQKLVDLPGNNFGVNVAFTDSTNAVAAWINDSDGNDSTGGSMVVYCNYNGASWDNTVTALTDANNDISYRELSMSFNGSYGAIAYCGSDNSTLGGQLNFVKGDFFKNNNWDTVNTYYFSDTAKYIRMPQVSISDSGFAAISYQTVNMFQDPTDVNTGQMNIALRDLNNGTQWDSIDITGLTSDASVYVWDMKTAFGNNNVLYTLSEENDTVVGNTYVPKTGITFGDPNLGLVLRGLKINSDLTADTVKTLPSVPDFIVEKPKDPISVKCYPNPFSNSMVLEYQVENAEQVRMDLYDMVGTQIGELINTVLAPGHYKLLFEPNAMNNGVYYFRVQLGNNMVTEKVVLMK